MGVNIEIQLFAEYDKVNFYTIRYEESQNSIFEDFMLSYEESDHYENLQRLLSWLENISKIGALERKFRTHEGKYGDSVCALPAAESDLRLYCLRKSNSILIIGGGGVKPPSVKTYNEIPELDNAVALLQRIDFLLNERIKQGQVQIIGKNMEGNLNFTL